MVQNCLNLQKNPAALPPEPPTPGGSAPRPLPRLDRRDNAHLTRSPLQATTTKNVLPPQRVLSLGFRTSLSLAAGASDQQILTSCTLIVRIAHIYF